MVAKSSWLLVAANPGTGMRKRAANFRIGYLNFLIRSV
ncbi:hypothetical protein VCHE39_2970 [Vibrio cholerae HE39]|nr:hypothetical protein VCHE39_2970 [Vibrio cholerae HE39]